MSIINNPQCISYLLHHGISPAIITIFEEQRITDEDLRTIDRDDIEHLFKNEYGFTFSDRKRLWNTIQKFQSENTKTDVLYIEEDESPDIYEITDDERSNHALTQHYTPSSNILSSAMIYDYSDGDNGEIAFEETNSEINDDTLKLVTTSSSLNDQFPKYPAPKKKTSGNCKFRYPIELPAFSTRVIKALETNNIESEWKALITELVYWILSITVKPLKKYEYQAIGETIFQIYPCIGKDGFRPWSYLCRCLAEYLRKERCRRGLPSLRSAKS